MIFGFKFVGVCMDIIGEVQIKKTGEKMIKGKGFTLTYKLRYENRLLS